MSESLSLERLLKLARATPEKLAAVDRLLDEQPLPGALADAPGSQAQPATAECGCRGNGEVLALLARIEGKVDALQKAQTEELKAEMWKVAEAIKQTAPAEPPINQGEAERIFAVLQRLRSKRAGMTAPLYDVFAATVLEGLSQRAAAKRSDCSPALLSKRVGELEKEFGLPLKQLQNYAKPLLEMETSVRGERYARKRRGAPQDEAGQHDDEDTQAAREDDNGYLPEERQDNT